MEIEILETSRLLFPSWKRGGYWMFAGVDGIGEEGCKWKRNHCNPSSSTNWLCNQFKYLFLVGRQNRPSLRQHRESNGCKVNLATVKSVPSCLLWLIIVLESQVFVQSNSAVDLRRWFLLEGCRFTCNFRSQWSWSFFWISCFLYNEENLKITMLRCSH